MDEELRAELLARREEDQRVRQAAITKPGHYGQIPDDIKEMLRVDEANTAWLAELTGRVGWPGRTLVGEDGAHAAWLLAQHADRQKHSAFLELLRAAVAAGEASAGDLAYLEDRVRVHAGQPQRYGTQFKASGSSRSSLAMCAACPATSVRFGSRRLDGCGFAGPVLCRRG